MSQAVALLVLRAHTGIHAGVGQEVGVVDLPIQRERVTNFPVVRGPSLKGALRQAATDKGLSAQELTWLFGPDTRDAPEHAGAMSVGDARLLLFPMRSLKGTFAWLTCPFAVDRLKRDLDDAGVKVDEVVANGPPTGRKVSALNAAPAAMEKVQVCGDDCGVAFPKPGQGQGQQIVRMVVVEDYGHEVLEQPPAQRPLIPLAKQLAALSKQGLTEAEIKSRLVLVKDETFQNFVSFCTEIVTRVHLDDETKTVKRGQLWTEELLPAESVLVALLVCSDQREKPKNGNGKKTGKDLLNALITKVGHRLQIGGNETVGYGVCHASWFGPFEI